MISAGDVFAASHEPMPSLPTWATAGSETQIKKRANNNNSAPILLSSELVKSSSNTSIDQTKLGTRPFLSSGSVNNDDTGSKAQVIKSILKHPSSSNNSSAESLHSVHSVHVANGSPELLKRSESIKSTKRSNSVKRDYYEMAESKPSKLSEGIVIPRNESNLSSQLEVGGSVSSERTSRIKQPSSPNPTHSPITTTGGGIDSNEQNLSASMGRKTKEQFRRLVASTSDLTDHSSGGSLVNHTQQQFHPLKNEVDRVSDASIQSLPPDGVIEMKAPIGGSLETGLKREGLEPSPDSKNDSSSIASVANASSEEEIISASMPALTASPQTLRDKKPRAKSALKNSLLGMLSSSDRSPVSSKSENKIDGGSSAGGGHKRHQSHNTLLRQSKPEPKSRSASEVPKPSSSEEVSSASLGSTMRYTL